MSGVSTKKIVQYAALPGILPRMKGFLSSGFGFIAFLMANTYNIVRLIPNNHPYLQSKNIGKFGIHQVIAQAANNLVFSRKNLDQILIFFTLLAGIAVLVLQFALIVLAFLLPQAFAQSIFVTPATTTAEHSLDIAYILLDKVFGIPEFFCAGNANSQCTDVLAVGGEFQRTPFHIALHEMLRFYSTGMLLIAVLIFMYFVVVIIGETATSGTPFGQRFQNVWVPIRLVVALGLLVPIHYGLNSAQYITLFAAKIGSSMATNGWNTFNRSVASNDDVFPDGIDDNGYNPTGERETLLAIPQAPDISSIVQFMSTVHACTYADWRMYNDKQNAYGTDQALLNTPPNELVNNPSYQAGPRDGFRIRPYLVKNALPWSNNQETVAEISKDSPYPHHTSELRFITIFGARVPVMFPIPMPPPPRISNYVEALDFNNDADITIVFGQYDPEKYSNFLGGVKPTCGSIRIAISDLKYKGDGDTYGGADYIQNFYFKMILAYWSNDFSLSGLPGNGSITLADKIKMLAYRITDNKLNRAPSLRCNIGSGPIADAIGIPPCDADENGKIKIGAEVKQNLVMEAQSDLKGAINYAWERYSTEGLDFDMVGIMDRGWGGAGMWYNNIAQISGGFINSVVETPQITKMPFIMEKVLEFKRINDSDFGFKDMYTPNFENNKEKFKEEESGGMLTAEALNANHQYWVTGSPQDLNPNKVISNNFFIDTVSSIFGLNGLLSIRGANMHIHPMAQLSAVGKSLVDSAVKSVGASIASGFAGGLMDGAYGKTAQIASKFLSSAAFLGLTAGIVLYYVLPFLPFLYFYFAVAQWIKGLFEAMVGVPLWALAHLRIDGNGLPGESASFGYFLIFEVFARPIMIVFGLIASMVIFTAQVRILNFTWTLVLSNLTGFSSGAESFDFGGEGDTFTRGAVDQFFFTLIYTIIVYMLATASFKLIDKIPDDILRWMGAGVSAFGDINTDPTESITRYASMAGTVVGPQITAATQEAASGTGGALKGLATRANAANTPKLPGQGGVG